MFRADMSGWKPHTPGHIAGEMVLQQRATERDPTRPLLTTLNERVSTIDGRLASVEQVATRSEFRTFGFWFGIIAILIALASWCRDYFGWSSPPQTPVAVPQSVGPVPLVGSLQPYSSPLPLASVPTAIGTASVQQATGSTSTPPRLQPP